MIQTKTIYKEKCLREEFQQFLRCPEINPPQQLSELVLSQIHKKLSTNPSFFVLKRFVICLLVIMVILIMIFAFQTCPLNSLHTAMSNFIR